MVRKIYLDLEGCLWGLDFILQAMTSLKTYSGREAEVNASSQGRGLANHSL